MPIYDYRCVACTRQVEVIHAIDAPGPAECDVCGGAMRKALSAPAIHFKGSGWAKKDAQAASRAKPKADADKGDDGKRDDGKSDAGESKDGGATDAKGSDADSGSAESGTSTSKPVSASSTASD